ncbi:copper fist DNA binding domain-containing protein [Aspergillus varians]
MPLDEEGKKWSCEPCLRGHRSSKCRHFDRLMVKVPGSGRPLKGCPHSKLHCGCRRSYAIMAPVSNDLTLCRPLHHFTGNPDGMGSGGPVGSLPGSLNIPGYDVDQDGNVRRLAQVMPVGSPGSFGEASDWQSRDVQSMSQSPGMSSPPVPPEYSQATRLGTATGLESTAGNPWSTHVFDNSINPGNGSYIQMASHVHPPPVLSSNGWSTSTASAAPVPSGTQFNRFRGYLSIPPQSTNTSSDLDTRIYSDAFRN